MTVTDPRLLADLAIPATVESSALYVRSGSDLVFDDDVVRMPAGVTASFGTYFNAFPIGYWAHATPLTRVVLEVQVEGAAQLDIRRSEADGTSTVVSTFALVDERLEYEIPFTGDEGGWAWFELTAQTDLTLRSARWLAATDEAVTTVPSAAIAITTMNRNEYCLAVLQRLASPRLQSAVSKVVVVDQGSQRIAEAAGFTAADAGLGGRLSLIEQANLGGSGGFARGMIEGTIGQAASVILLDDDIALEPESVRRLVTFAAYSHDDRIVGGHMFDIAAPTVLHAFAERVRSHDFMWGPITPARHDFADGGLAETPWLHRRYDAGYTAWFMALIPASVIDRIGLPWPLFIKWDDAEYSLRAAAAGIETVTLPGAAVWHVSWLDKEDSRDWQAFFHARNRLIAALLFAQTGAARRLRRMNVAFDLRLLITMDFYAVRLRQLAYQSVLDGPAALHADLSVRITEIRAMAAEHVEARPRERGAALDLVPSGVAPAIPGWRKALLFARAVFAHATVGARPHEHPEGFIPAGADRWWVIARYRDVVVEHGGGSIVQHRRDPARFRRMALRSIGLGLRLGRRWAELGRTYRAASEQVVSREQWRRTLGITDG